MQRYVTSSLLMRRAVLTVAGRGLQLLGEGGGLCDRLFLAEVMYRKSSSHSPHQLVSQGRYRDALEVWEQAKCGGSTSPELYTPLMRLAHMLGSATAAKELYQDMLRQQWPMDSKCAYHYTCALISEGFVEEVVSFLSTNHLEEPALLSAVAEKLEDGGHYNAALLVCGMSCSPLLQATQLELLGRHGDTALMAELLHKHYSGGSFPHQVEVGLVNGLAFAGKIDKAVDIVTSATWRVSVLMLAMLLEGVCRSPDIGTARRVVALLPASLSGGQSSHSLRAINAALQLQAIAHRDSFITDPIMEDFVNRDLYQELQAAALDPDMQTCQALLLLYCCDESVKGSVYKAFSLCREHIDKSCLTSWVELCGTLQPSQANRVIGAVFALSRTLDLQPDIRHLLSLTVQGDAMLVIHWAKNILLSHGLLQDASAVLCAVARLSMPQALYSIYGELVEAGFEPSLGTFHQLLDSVAGSQLMSSEAMYGLWRLLVRERIAPDVELLNKLLKCCQVTHDAERCLFFLSVFNQYQLQPSVESYTTLLQACADDKERVTAIVELASKCFPSFREHL